MATRECTGKTKRGTPCKAAPLKGRTTCLAHSDPETRGSVGFTAEAGKLGGRPRLPRPAEIAQRLIEQNELALQRPYWRTLGYDVVIGANGPELVELETGGAKLYGTSKTGAVRVSEHDDLGAMMAAAEKLQDRVYGRPKQVQEISGLDGDPVQVSLPTAGEWHAQVAQALAEAGCLSTPEPSPGDSGSAA